jgi:predicted permease
LFALNARQAGYKGASLAQFYTDLLNDFRRIPGVHNAGLSQFPLVIGSWNSLLVTIPGSTPASGRKPETCYVPVNAEFLATMQIPILLGRGLEERDMSSPRVAVVTEQFAKKFFAGDNPIGRRIGLGGSKKPADIEIIGVAKTTLYNSIKETETPPVVYVPYTQDLGGLGRVHFELRTGGDPLALVNTVRETVHRASASVPLSEISTQAARIDQTISQERTFAMLGSCFAVLAVLIACVGLYGLMAYTVARRTNEIGIRIALGARRPRVIWMFLREALAMAAVGLAIGLPAAFAASRFVKSFLFQMKSTDPLVPTLAASTLFAAALLAGYVPAWRASKVDPWTALRDE